MPYADPEKARLYARAHYETNKQTYKDRAREYSDQQRDRLRSIKDEAKSVPCADCGVQYPPYVMDFDHVTGGPKRFNLANAPRAAVSTATMQTEIDKCEVVCANCHRERTHNRGLPTE